MSAEHMAGQINCLKNGITKLHENWAHLVPQPKHSMQHEMRSEGCSSARVAQGDQRTDGTLRASCSIRMPANSSKAPK